MKKAAIALVVLLVTTPLFAMDAYPKTSIAEDLTATWCGYCPRAYAGLDIVHGEHDFSQFVSVRYYASSGSYGTPEVEARIQYYANPASYPTVVINGTTKFVGAAASTATTGEPYLSTVGGAMMVPAPVRVEIDSFNPTSGAVSATVTMHSTTRVLNDDILLLVLVEDDVTSEHNHVARDLIQETFDLSGAGNTHTTTTSFVVDPSWNTAKLNAVALVQHANGSEVLQVGSTFPKPNYELRAMVPSSVTIGPSTAPTATDVFAVVNTGLADSYTIELVVDEAPPGWQINLEDEFGGTHTIPYPFALAAGATTDFHFNVIPTTPGYASFHVEVTSPNLTTPTVIPFAFNSDDLSIMLVDDDGGEPFEDYFRAALDGAGIAYGFWDRNLSTLTDDVAQNYDVLIWNAGLTTPSLDADDKIFVGDFLDAGGALFLSGQDVGWDLNDANPDPVWYQTYLHATWIRDDTNIMYLDGLMGDPVTGGMALHIDGGDGASNQEYPDEIAAADNDATEIFFYQGDGCGAVRSLDSLTRARVVYLGFGFEGIDNAQDRSDLLVNAIAWIGPEVFSDGFEDGSTSAWSNVTP